MDSGGHSLLVSSPLLEMSPVSYTEDHSRTSAPYVFAQTYAADRQRTRGETVYTDEQGRIGLQHHAVKHGVGEYVNGQAAEEAFVRSRNVPDERVDNFTHHLARIRT